MMFTRIREIFAAPVFEGEEDKTRRARLLNAILWAVFLIFAIASPVLLMVNRTLVEGTVTKWLLTGFLLIVLGLLRMLRSGRVRLTSMLFSFLALIMITVTILFFGGIRSDMAFGYLMVIFISGLLLGRREAFLFGFLGILAILGVFCAEYYFRVDTIEPPATHSNFDNLFTLLTFLALIMVLVDLVVRNTTEALERAWNNERALSESLDELSTGRAELEARTFDLEHRSAWLRAAAQVSRDITATLELDEMMNLAVSLIREYFDFYHVAIFLTGDRGEYAVLQAATGDAGQQMLERGHRLKVGMENIVGYAVDSAWRHVDLHVSGDEGRPKYPLLPQTRSEAALPLRMGQKVIGVLNIHSREEAAFDDDGLAILQTMTDQLAAVIQNAHLISEMQQTVRELESVSGQYTRESWQDVARGVGQSQGYRYRRLEVEPAAERSLEARRAWLQGRSVVIEGDDQDAVSALAAPMKLRGQVIGVLNMQFEGASISDETITLVEEVADRLALALENARLFGETGRTAWRERLAREVMAKVQSATDVDNILQIAVRELGQALDAPRSIVQLSTHTDEVGRQSLEASEVNDEL